MMNGARNLLLNPKIICYETTENKKVKKQDW